MTLYAAGEQQFLTLTGACVDSQPQPDPVVFSCAVRSSSVKSIIVENGSTTSWQLRPTIQNDYWNGPEFLHVPSGGKAVYEITYTPLMMCTEDQPQSGSVFFPIPDGSGLLYILHGFASAPEAEDNIKRDVKAKCVHIEKIGLNNWLQRPQRFHVEFERVQCDEATVIQV